MLGRQLPGNDLPSVLKDGCILCELVNTMFNGVIKTIHPPDSQPYELRDVCFPSFLFFFRTKLNNSDGRFFFFFFHITFHTFPHNNRTLHNSWTS